MNLTNIVGGLTLKKGHQSPFSKVFFTTEPLVAIFGEDAGKN